VGGKSRQNKLADGTPCTYCHRTMIWGDKLLAPTRDHSIPRVHGGRKTKTIGCCFQCNNIKDNMMPEMWQAFMDKNPKWWLLDRRRLWRARRGLIAPVRNTPKSIAASKPKQGSPKIIVVVPPDLIF
jgi:hypothetical protein